MLSETTLGSEQPCGAFNFAVFDVVMDISTDSHIYLQSYRLLVSMGIIQQSGSGSHNPRKRIKEEVSGESSKTSTSQSYLSPWSDEFVSLPQTFDRCLTGNTFRYHLNDSDHSNTARQELESLFKTEVISKQSAKLLPIQGSEFQAHSSEKPR